MILTRTGYSARSIERALLEAKIPYIFIGGRKLLESAHVKDVLSCLKVVANSKDDLGWIRFLKLWPGIGDVKASNLIKELENNDTIKSEVFFNKETIFDFLIEKKKQKSFI